MAPSKFSTVRSSTSLSLKPTIASISSSVKSSSPSASGNIYSSRARLFSAARIPILRKFSLRRLEYSPASSCFEIAGDDSARISLIRVIY